MALRSKDSTLQLRLESELLQRFKEMCEEDGRPVSWVVRDFMRERVEQWEKRKGRQVAVAAPAAAPVPVVDLDDDDDDDSNPARKELSRQQRRQLERDMRKRGQ